MIKVFVYFGRLEIAKGFDLILANQQDLLKNNLCVVVFGQGSLANSLSLSSFKGFKVQPGLFYFGYQDFETIIKPFLAKQADYTLMPSRVLETFGFSALESMSLGVPVIGPQKGGIAQFIKNKEALAELSPSALLAKLIKLPKRNQEVTQKYQKIAAAYNSETWLKNFQAMVPAQTKKILLVSDFLAKLGGTEVFVYRVKDLLEANGYEVKLFSSNKQASLWNMLKAIRNKSEAERLQKTIAEFKPDLIWVNSIMRYLGVEVLKVINDYPPSFKVSTQHDFGLLHKRPSQLKFEAEIANSKLGLKGVIWANPVLRELNKFDLNLLPSEFMLKHYETKLQNLEVLKHFI